jgi:hypothetical protein
VNLRDLLKNRGAFDTVTAQSTGRGGSGLISLELENCSQLLDRFFSRVHIKNPVLDEEEVRQWAKEVAFHGIGWNAQSCLVVGSFPSNILF